MHRQQIVGWAIVLGTLFELSLIAVGVLRHPTSLQGSGSAPLRTDVALLLAYGIAGVVVQPIESYIRRLIQLFDTNRELTELKDSRQGSSP